MKKGILLTTGATETTNLQNIYDMAGNVLEWTKEFYNTSSPCVLRGGRYDINGSEVPVEYRGAGNTSGYSYHLGFRIGLWK